jgi:hypothetical protein
MDRYFLVHWGAKLSLQTFVAGATKRLQAGKHRQNQPRKE